MEKKHLKVVELPTLLQKDEATDLIEDARNAAIFVGASLEKLIKSQESCLFEYFEDEQIKKGMAQVFVWIDKSLKQANERLNT